MADIEDISARIESAVQEINDRITSGMKQRAFSAANELRNSSQEILRGQRSGRVYRVPGTKSRYTASAPGEPPADRTNAFREGWQPQTEVSGSGNNLTVKSYIENSVRTDDKEHKYLLGEILEEGTSRMAPRPYQEQIKQDALPQIVKIYRRPYF